MAKSEKQKLKLLALRDILMEKTDADHTLSTTQLVAELEKLGIHAERKSIYTDILALEEYGIDIHTERGRSNQYSIEYREFELAELKMLVDVVQSARFITEKKSRELISKLEHQASIYEAKQLSRNVIITNRSKTSNENIFYNVDSIHHALASDCQIQFYYYEWTVEKKLAPRKNGKPYQVSPWALIWDNENYYLLAYDAEANLIKHYRVDKMKKLTEIPQKRLGQEAFANFDLASFQKATFGMFAGEEVMVTLLAKRSLTGVILDRFGTAITLRALDDTTIEARVPVKISNQFYGWLAGLGTAISILGPENVKNAYLSHLATILKQAISTDT
ncbi:Predicted DNA-binding transcriptional regulator YafY, contains an HTH and WYL domains [Lachnospiraceae bacterium XBB1006]|nr:Predicted DNA-binding transcriptional regulator YafY, contains an HTH and WYL domains [Lachnospiraceae bacterium XBB1006]